MKGTFLQIIALFLVVSTVSAQQVKRIQIYTVSPKINEEYQLSGVSPNGKNLLLTKAAFTGLYLLNIHSRTLSTVTVLPGTGYRPTFSKRGKFIVYRADDYSQKKRFSSLFKMKLSTMEVTQLESQERVVSSPLVVGNDIIYTVEGSMKQSKFYGWILSDPDDKTFVMSEDLQPELWRQGFSKTYHPAGEGSYIWISLSPNRKLMLFYVAGKGAFVSDLNGNILHKLGNIMNPGWLNNSYVYGVGTRGSDPKSTATDLVGYSLKTGKRFTITETASINERNPFAFDKGRKIAYQTTSGLFNIVQFNIQ